MSNPLYFYTPGTCALSGLVVLEWLGKPYQLCRVEREQRSSDVYKRINPFGKVPAVRTDDGRVIIENSAILLHLTQRHPDKQLAPAAGTPAWDMMNQWLSYLGSGFHPAFFPYFGPGRYIANDSQHGAIRDASVLQIRAQLAYVDQQIGSKQYLLGDQSPSIVDAYLTAMVRWAYKFIDVEKEYLNLSRHHQLLKNDPGVQFAFALERDITTASPSGALMNHIDLQQQI